MLPACKELGIGFAPWSPLGQAYFTGTVRVGTDFPKDNMRQLLPHFKKDAMEANQPLIDALNEVGRDKNFTSAQVDFPWLLSQHP